MNCLLESGGPDYRYCTQLFKFNRQDCSVMSRIYRLDTNPVIYAPFFWHTSHDHWQLWSVLSVLKSSNRTTPQQSPVGCLLSSCYIDPLFRKPAILRVNNATIKTGVQPSRPAAKLQLPSSAYVSINTIKTLIMTDANTSGPFASTNCPEIRNLKVNKCITTRHHLNWSDY